MSELRTRLRYLRAAPRKVRLVAAALRGLRVQAALDVLMFSRVRSAVPLAKLIRSAVSSAEKKGGVDVDRLVIRTLLVDQGPTMRRFLARARGSASRINKKTSHVTLVLEEAR